MKQPNITTDEIRIRYIAACDEIKYLAEQLAKYMGMQTTYEESSDLLNGLIERVEGTLEDIELIRDDAEPEGKDND